MKKHVLKPTNLNLMRLLQQLFVQQAREVASRISFENVPDVSHWASAMAKVVLPIMVDNWQAGMLKLVHGKTAFVGKKLTNGLIVVKGPTGKPIAAMDIRSPRVLDAVDAAVLAFCRETMETAYTESKEAVESLREEMKEGLSKKEAMNKLHARVQSIFADPFRASKIVNTEVPRFVFGGMLMAANDSGIYKSKKWHAGPGACETCRGLDGIIVPLNKPFVVLGNGPYGRIMSPPYHPFCYCEMEVLHG